MKQGIIFTALAALLISGCGQNTQQVAHQQVEQDTIQDIQNMNNAILSTFTKH